MPLRVSEASQHITLVTIDNQPKRNAMSRATLSDLAALWDRLEASVACRCVVITGAGDKAFCAGADIDGDLTASAETARIVNRALLKTTPFSKPIIAAVNGVAMGGGFEIALACDLIIASENAMFALPEPRVGLAALAGGLHRLPRQIGLKRAMGMILTARHVSAREGHELGFVNEVVPQGEALAAAERWAETICKNSPMSIRASKQTIQKGLAVSLEQALAEQRDYPAVKAMVASQDYIEGPKAFSEKRPPKWVGR